MCASTIKFGRGGNNVHFVSKHVSRNEFGYTHVHWVFGLD
jgi:hypothetical protein